MTMTYRVTFSLIYLRNCCIVNSTMTTSAMWIKPFVHPYLYTFNNNICIMIINLLYIQENPYSNILRIIHKYDQFLYSTYPENQAIIFKANLSTAF